MINRSSMPHVVVTVLFLALPLATSGCAAFFAGAAAGAGGYETYQHNEMQQLEEEYAAGKIDKDEYEARKRQIERSSVLQ
jgi:uncharacterized membrane protein